MVTGMSGMVTDKYIGGGVDKGHAAKLAFFGLAIEVDGDRHGWSSEVQCGWGGMGWGGHCTCCQTTCSLLWISH